MAEGSSSPPFPVSGASPTPEPPKPTRRGLALSVRLALVASAILAVALTVGGIAFHAALRSAQSEEFDHSARERVAAIVRLVETGSVPAKLPTPRDSPLLAQVIAPDGRVVGSTPNVSDMRAIAPATSWKGQREIVRKDKAMIDQADCALFSTSVQTPTGEFGVLVAAPTRPLRRAERMLTRQMLLFGPFLLVVSALVLWWLARRVLRPVDRLRREVDAISAHDLTKRVTAPVVDDEVGRLASTMNALLDRLSSASQRQTRFVSDASHELRSPLASMRTQLEVGLQRGSATDWPALADDVLRDSRRMERLVGNLLTLARVDGAPVPLRTDVDLDDIVLAEVANSRAVARSLVFVTSGVSAGRITGDADQLRRVVINLLDNASRYADSTVTVTLSQVDESVVLTITDDGPGIPEDQRGRVFERFARIEESRSRGRGELSGSGLGLAIVAEIVRMHNGTIAISDAVPHGAVFTLAFPAAE